ncbi:MAG TPA: hypothetical protein PKN57_08105 [Saprospiraceae bacterium]|nr:hypothetical protein [Saprospiraceae bacterium]MCC6688945.1 hypothetical protein [Saprospiraceae bacterium]HNA41044.1 hypothetical protein [Saprospiraceae bacterium]HNA94926.1 hypothetical protein [Saprospiraceae bacterium]HND17318.1 hypothetical protein [Saprospiraceae bacterium]
MASASAFNTASNARSLTSARATGCASACSAVSQMYSSLEHTYNSHTPSRKHLPKPHPDTPVPNLRLSESLQHQEVQFIHKPRESFLYYLGVPLSGQAIRFTSCSLLSFTQLW